MSEWEDERMGKREDIKMIKEYEKAYKMIQDAHHIVVASHINPDGDTLGSMLGLGIALKKTGKKITYFNKEEALPKKFDFLPSYTKIKSSLPSSFDLLICVDAASFERIGIDKASVPSMIAFDHHKSNTKFADINIVDPTKVSTSLVVLDFLQYFTYEITKECAISLYTALVEDSGFFKFDRVKQETFEKAAYLVKKGANPANISNMLTNRNSLAKIRLMQRYLEALTLKNNATVCLSKITLNDFKQTGALRSDSDSFVNIGLSLATVHLSIFMYEVDREFIKFSLRSKDDSIDCSQIALHYGGGGHKRAAGFTAKIKDTNDIIQDIILKIKN